MYCTQCGKESRDSDRYCGQCGSVTGVEGSPPRAASDAAPAPPKRLLLSRKDKKAGGVCAGFAEYLGWDVTIVRLLYICGVVYSGGLGLLAYLIAWIVIPAEPVMPSETYASGVPAVRSA
jgi:phage shock protein C